MKKNKIIFIISSTLIVIALILGISFKSAFDRINSIKVTGSAKKDFISDELSHRPNLAHEKYFNISKSSS